MRLMLISRGMDSDSSFPSSCFSPSSTIGVVVVTHEEDEEEKKEEEKAISIGSVSLLIPSMECSRI